MQDIRKKVRGSGTKDDPFVTLGALWNMTIPEEPLPSLTKKCLQQILENGVNGHIFGTLDPANPKKDTNDTHRFKCPLSEAVDPDLCLELTREVQSVLSHAGYPHVLGTATVIRSEPGGTNQVFQFARISFHFQDLSH
jgi:hypothetical protein